MIQFLIRLKWRLAFLPLLISACASAQSPEVYAFPWTNAGYASHAVGTGANAFIVGIGGSYDANGYGSGTDEFIGPNGVPGDQEIGGVGFPEFGTLVVNNGEGKLLTITETGLVSIYTGITFISGIISNRALGSSYFILYKNTAASPTTASNSSFVDGYVNAGVRDFTFPVGDISAAAGTQYHPLSIEPGTGSGFFIVSYSASMPPNSSNLSSGIAAIDPASYWTFDFGGFATGVVSVLTRDETAVFGPSAQVFLAGYNISTNQWENVSGSSTLATGPDQMLSSSAINMRQYSAFSVGSTSTPLPDSLVSFAATAEGCNAVLSWKKAMEQNRLRYEIERSTDGVSFNKVTEVESRNSANKAGYRFQFEALNSRTSYFRLRMVDFDGRATYSPVVSVICNCSPGSKIVVVPNPAKDVINVRGLDDGRNQIMLMDINGKKLVELIGSGTDQWLQVGSYPKGTYILRVISADGKIVNVKIQKE